MNRYMDNSVCGRSTSYPNNIAANVQVIKGNGKVDSMGVYPDGRTGCTGTSEIEFTLNIFRRGNNYFGEVYIVNYDTRKKINSNTLTYFEQRNDLQVLCIFEVSAGPCRCNYDLVVTVSPTSCGNDSKGMFFAYVSPVFGTELNVGGELTSGEIIFYCSDLRNNDCSCNYNCNCDENVVVANINQSGNNDCTYYAKTTIRDGVNVSNINNTNVGMSNASRANSTNNGDRSNSCRNRS